MACAQLGVPPFARRIAHELGSLGAGAVIGGWQEKLEESCDLSGTPFEIFGDGMQGRR